MNGVAEAEKGDTPPPGQPVQAGHRTLQQLHDAGINPFAVELVSESYHTSALRKAFPANPVAFIWDGVKITLEYMDEPRHPRIRKELGLPKLDERS